MDYTFDVKITRSEIKRATIRLVLKIFGFYFLAAFFLCVGLVVWDMRDGQSGWPTILVISLILIFLVLARVGNLFFERGLTHANGKKNAASVSYRLTPEKIVLSSEKGESEAVWGDLMRLWIERDLTVLFYHGDSSTMIPTGQIPADALEFLIQNAKREGVSVVNALEKGSGEAASNSNSGLH